MLSITMFSKVWTSLSNQGEKTPNPRAVSEVISETLLEELEAQIKIVDSATKERETRRKLDDGIPDYSWLTSTPINNISYKLPHLVRLELESLAQEVNPDDTSKVISDFQSMITEETRVHELSECLKCSLLRYVATENSRASSKKCLTKAASFSSNTSSICRDRPSSRLKRFERWRNVSQDRPPANTTENRTQSAPPSSWKFVRHVKVCPLQISVDPDSDTESRSYSVPAFADLV